MQLLKNGTAEKGVLIMAIDFEDFLKSLNRGEKSPQESPKDKHQREHLELERQRLELAKEKARQQEQARRERAEEKRRREERREKAEQRGFIIGILASIGSLLVTILFALLILWRF